MQLVSLRARTSSAQRPGLAFASYYLLSLFLDGSWVAHATPAIWCPERV